MTNPFDAFIAEYRETINYWKSYQIQQPPPPDEPPRSRRVIWKPAQATKRPPPTMSIDDARTEMYKTMEWYANESRPNRILLVRAAPGMGKTYASVKLAQNYERGRVLYCMPNHNHFESITQLPIYRPEYWYHWLATHATIPGTEQTMCKETATTIKLMQKGWPLRLACDGICGLYAAECPYKVQSNQPEQIIAGVHEHIVTGLNVPGLQLAIVDEEPMRAFLSSRSILARDLPGDGIGIGPIGELIAKIRQLVASGGRFEGKLLMGMIGDLVGDVQAQAEFDLLPGLPKIGSRSDIEDLPAWIVPDLLKLLVPEHECWQRGLDNWLNRIIISDGKLHLLSRSKTWAKLPKRLIVVDATANAAVYGMLFPGREIEVYEPSVKQRGRVYQVLSHYNGKGTINDEQTNRLLMAVDEIASRYNRPGIVTFKDLEPAFAAMYGPENVLHFGAQRGSNALENCDVGIITNTPSPRGADFINMATVLNPGRVEPFHTSTNDNGQIIPLWSVTEQPYNYTVGGQQPWQMIPGFWHDADLATLVHAKRENEIVQAIHRFRILFRNVPVYVFSNVPTGQKLTGVYESMETMVNAPPIPCTNRCSAQCAHKNSDGTQKYIPWYQWLKIKRWLDAAPAGMVVDTAKVAEIVGANPNYVRDRGWVRALLSAGIIGKIEQPAGKSRGRPKIEGITA